MCSVKTYALLLISVVHLGTSPSYLVWQTEVRYRGIGKSDTLCGKKIRRSTQNQPQLGSRRPDSESQWGTIDERVEIPPVSPLVGPCCTRGSSVTAFEIRSQVQRIVWSIVKPNFPTLLNQLFFYYLYIQQDVYLQYQVQAEDGVQYKLLL